MPSFGWRPDLPDWRDYTPDHPKVVPLLGRLKAVPTPPQSTDLRQWCSPVEDQGALGSCTAQAAAGLYEYFERRAFGKHVDVSTRFIYKVTRNLMHETGDVGAYGRTTMGALVFFGAPPEVYWPYDVVRFDVEPPAFVYALGQGFQALKYFRLDDYRWTPPEVLNQLKVKLAQKIPLMLGFTCFESLNGSEADRGYIPFPKPTEGIIGGHMIDVVGHDDRVRCPNATPGALLIRNSWGSWGEAGYGWLPYDYILRGAADDLWGLIKGEWVDTGIFAE